MILIMLVYGKKDSIDISGLTVYFSNHYFCTVHAARLMTARKQGLIVVISSPGGLRYLFNVAYGVGKAAVSLSDFFLFHQFKHEKLTFSAIVWRLIRRSN